MERPQYTFLRIAVGLSYPRTHTTACRCPECEHHEHLDECGSPVLSPLVGCAGCFERMLDKINKTSLFTERTTFGKATPEVLAKIRKIYGRLSDMDYMHASPTMFNIGTKCQQMSSCFLSMVKDDSVHGIYDTNKSNALISQSGGGIGNNVSNIRASGSRIVTTNGKSNGLVPMLKNYQATALHAPSIECYSEDESTATNLVMTLKEFNETSRYMDQGGGKRKGAFAIYIESWHADFLNVLEMRLPDGPPETRGTDLFYAVWQSDLFMERLIASDSGKKRVTWSLFCPKDAPGLQDAYGPKFKELYERYEKEGKARKRLDIWDVWKRILHVQQKTGNPYMMYKDAVNRRNNQEHIGTVRGSNLCTEITEFTSPDEVAVCNLANIVIISCFKPGFVNPVDGVDYEKIVQLAYELTYNLNEVVDRTRYPVPEARYSNLRHRPIGLGIQGLADLFHKLRIAYDSLEAQEINHRVFECIYFGAIKASCELAKRDGPYETYSLKTPIANGSKISRGILVFDECRRPAVFNSHVFPPEKGFYDSYNEDGTVKTFMDWKTQRKKVAKYGVRNSLLVAPMPTASTSKVTGCNESFEPYTSNVFDFNTLVGTNEVVNQHLVEELKERDLWTADIYERIVAAEGSVADIAELPEELRWRYRTIWEIEKKAILLMSAARQLFIDQSQSFNIHLSADAIANHTNIHVLGYLLHLKTGSYYVFTKTQAKQMQIKQTQATVSSRNSVPERVERIAKETREEQLQCSLVNKENCLSCQ